MSKNRTELETQVDTDIVATLAIADHRTFLKDELIDSTVLRKDVIASETPGGGTVSINFANKDLATVTTTANLAVSFTGMENGDVKYLAITKNAGNTISFTGATDVSIRKDYINANALTVYYQVFYKNGVIFLNSLNIDNDIFSGSVFGKLDIGTWDMDSLTVLNVPFSAISGKAIAIEDVIILPDSGTTRYSLLNLMSSGVADGGVNYVTTSNIQLSRNPGGFFDSSGFSGSSNRGYISYRLIDI